MPKKPIKPDRVRIPRPLRRARLRIFAVAIFLAPAIILLERIVPNPLGLGPTMAIALSIVFLVHIWANVREGRTRKALIDRLLKHNGLLCPRCAYPLTGLDETHTRVTCPECGEHIDDTAQLLTRWNRSVGRYYWLQDPRLKTHMAHMAHMDKADRPSH